MEKIRKKINGLGWDDKKNAKGTKEKILSIIKKLGTYGIKLHFEDDVSIFIDKINEFSKNDFQNLDFLLLDMVDDTHQNKCDRRGLEIAKDCRSRGFFKPIFIFSADNSTLVKKDRYLTHPYMLISKDTDEGMIGTLIKDFLSFNQITQDIVFIGHGGASREWEKLGDYLSKKEILWEEFEHSMNAGIGSQNDRKKIIIDRLERLKKRAGLAILVYSNEDYTHLKKVRARQNVVHETGFFQGGIGIDKTIIIAQEECELFSNISGILVRKYKKNIMEIKEKILDDIRSMNFIVE